MFLIIDSETSGLMKRELPIDHEGQPWVVSLSAELCDTKLRQLDFFSTRIRADGRKIEAEATGVHGISSADAGRSGIPEVTAIGMLCHFASQARYVVGFGIDFDRKVIESILMRRRKDTRLWVREGLEFVDVMKPAAHICKLPSPHESGSPRWPSLDEACEIILGEPPREGSHTGWDDLQRTKRLFSKLAADRVIEIPEIAA